MILSVRNGDGDGFKGLDHYPDGLPIRFYRSGQLWGMNLNRSGLRRWNTKADADGLLEKSDGWAFAVQQHCFFIGDIHGDVLVLWKNV